MTLGRTLAALVLSLACAHALLPSHADRDALRLRLVGAVERATARLAAPTACEAEPGARFDVALDLGPLARVLAATGRGERVDALEAALCEAGRRVSAGLAPWLAEAAAGFDAPDVETLLATGGATPALRAQLEGELASRVANEADAAVVAAGVPARLDRVGEAAKGLPLPRPVTLEPGAWLRAHWPDAFFAVVAEEEALALSEPRAAVATLVPAPRDRTGSAALGRIR